TTKKRNCRSLVCSSQQGARNSRLPVPGGSRYSHYQQRSDTPVQPNVLWFVIVRGMHFQIFSEKDQMIQLDDPFYPWQSASYSNLCGFLAYFVGFKNERS